MNGRNVGSQRLHTTVATKRFVKLRSDAFYNITSFFRAIEFLSSAVLAAFYGAAFYNIMPR